VEARILAHFCAVQARAVQAAAERDGYGGTQSPPKGGGQGGGGATGASAAKSARGPGAAAGASGGGDHASGALSASSSAASAAVSSASSCALVATFMDPLADVFKSLAARWGACSPADVTDEQRGRAKQMCYALLYGQGDAAIARALGDGVTAAAAARHRASFFQAFPNARSFQSRVVRRCRESGAVRTLFGRFRHLPEISSADRGRRSHAERQAVNTTCQGSAADLIKVTMAEIHRRVLRWERARDWSVDARASARPGGGSASSRAGGLSDIGALIGARCLCPRVRLVLQIHDELVFEVPEDRVSEVAAIVQASMERACTLEVPLVVKLKVGRRWGGLVDYCVGDKPTWE
jgi:DNA polymerase theta